MKAMAMKPDPADPRRRKRALLTGVALGAIAVAIYVYVVVQYLTR